MTSPNRPHIIVTGNVVEGFEFYGPFRSREGAIQSAELEFDRQEWCACSVSPPSADAEIVGGWYSGRRDPYAAAAQARGWIRAGDGDGFIYNTNQYESWKAAVSWAGDGGPNDNGPIYDSWKKCCEAEEIEVSE